MKKPILLYSLLAYAFTWAVVIGLYLAFRSGRITELQLNLYYSLGALGPTVAALLTAAVCHGRSGVVKLLAHLKPVRPTRQVWLLAWSPLLFFALGLVVYPLIKGGWYDFGRFFAEGQLDQPVHLIAWFLPFIVYALFEEMGWRGFLLPHLQEKRSAFQATAILTVIWSFWHAPFFLFRFDFSLLISVGFFFGIFVGSMVLTSLYNASKGYYFSAILFHLANNLASAFDQEIVVAVVSTGLIFVAILLYRKYGPDRLAPAPRVANYFLTADGS